MHIVHIASEMAPAAKVGGLGDVILGLARETQARGHKVEVVIPKYSTINYEAIEGLSIVMHDLWSLYGDGWVHNTVWSGYVSGIKVYFIEPHNTSRYFGRPTAYGQTDDIERFTYFSRAALEFLLKSGANPDILHIHEWQTALVAPLYWDVYHQLGLNKAGIVMTLHNLEHQGHCTTEELDRVGLCGEKYLVADKLQHSANPHVINLLKGGIVYSNYVTTVSPTYAQEAKLPKYGMGLDSTLVKHADKFEGVLNGLDYDYWNPETDRYLAQEYGANYLAPKGKLANKQELKRRLLLNDNDALLVGSVGRLVPQKGVHLLKAAIFETLNQGGQFVLLGSSPIPAINEEFYNLKVHFSDNPNVHLELNPHEELTHLIFSGSDFFIVPSLFEPCGLTQLIALRYGAIPIVRRTGGLADTVFDIGDQAAAPRKRNGFCFDEPDIDAVNGAIQRAAHLWTNERKEMEKLIVKGMQMDFSWGQPTEIYLAKYQWVQDLLHGPKKKKRAALAIPLPVSATA